MFTKKIVGGVETRIGVLALFMLAVVVATSGTFAMLAPVSAQEAETDPNEGILVAAVQPDSAADAAGLVRGDIILSINDESVEQVSDLTEMLDNVGADAELTLRVLHGDEVRTLTVTLGDDGVLGIVPLGSDLMSGVRRQGTPFGNRPSEQPEMPNGSAQLPPMQEFMPGISTPGAVIVEVVPGGPADEAGLQGGDIIMAVDGEELTVDSDLAGIIGTYAPGDEITLEIAQSLNITDEQNAEDIQATETFEVVVTLGESDTGNALLGVRYTNAGAFQFSPEMLPEGMNPFMPGPDDSTPFELPQNGEQEQDGPQQVMVMQVAPDSPAAEAGLEPGDVITAIDGAEITSPDDLVEIIASHDPGDEITLSIAGADGEEIELVVALGENDEGAAFLGVAIGAVPAR